MSKKNLEFVVKGSPAPGFQFVFCAGYGWGANGTKVEVDQSAETDPNLPHVICNKTLDDLKADPRISVTIDGMEDEITALRKRVVELEAENAELKALVGDGDGEAKKDAEGGTETETETKPQEKARLKAEAKAKKDAEGGK